VDRGLSVVDRRGLALRRMPETSLGVVCNPFLSRGLWCVGRAALDASLPVFRDGFSEIQKEICGLLS
jgi:hypothetical protein